MQEGSLIKFAVAPIETVRVGFIGLGSRGMAAVGRYVRIDGAEVTAVCDVNRIKVDDAMRLVGHSGTVTGYCGSDAWKSLCEKALVDLVYICTDWQSHADIACYAMECGRHVAVEVPAATSVEECFRLVRTAERTGRHCMMLENCIYDLFEASTFDMVKAGVFGDILHAEGGYIHNLEYLNRWRDDFNRTRLGDNYPTHGLGPICRLMGIHRTDNLHSITSFSTPMPKGSHTVSVIRTKKGKTMILQHDIHAPRPYSRMYQFMGEKGFVSKYPDMRISMLPSADVFLSEDRMMALLEDYRPDYSGVVRALMPDGLEERRYMDYAMDYRLVHCLRHGLPLDMDVYDAAEWSCVSELSHRSIESGSLPVLFPDFLTGEPSDYHN